MNNEEERIYDRDKAWDALPEFARDAIREEYRRATDVLIIDPKNQRAQAVIQLLMQYFGEINLTCCITADKTKKANRKSQIALSEKQMRSLLSTGWNCSGASMQWVKRNGTDEAMLIPCREEHCHKNTDGVVIPAFTLEDILNILPECIEMSSPYWLRLHKDEIVKVAEVAYINSAGIRLWGFIDKTLIGAGYAMLQHLIKTNTNFLKSSS